jgi:integrase
MASLEQRGNHYRIIFRLGGRKHHVSVKAGDRKEAEACLVRLEDNLRLVERGKMCVPAGADLGIFLITDGKLEKPVESVRNVRLSELFRTYQSQFTVGAKEAITREMEDIHMKHLARIIGGETPLAAVTAGTVQQFVDARSREEHNGHPVKPKTVRKAVATLRFVWNWANRQGHVPTKFPTVELVFPKEKQPEPFRTFDQIKAILARGGIDKRRERELWDGLFLDPSQIAEVLAHVKRKTSARYLHPLLVTAAHTGARRSELFRARVEDIDFDAKLILLREKKRSRDRETFRTVDMTPFVESVMRVYFAEVRVGDFRSRPRRRPRSRPRTALRGRSSSGRPLCSWCRDVSRGEGEDRRRLHVGGRAVARVLHLTSEGQGPRRRRYRQDSPPRTRSPGGTRTATE